MNYTSTDFHSRFLESACSIESSISKWFGPDGITVRRMAENGFAPPPPPP